MDDSSAVKEEIRNILGITGNIISELGPRIAGTESCKKAAEKLCRLAEQDCGYGVMEKFTQHPQAFFCIPVIFASCFTAAAALSLFGIKLLAVSAGILLTGAAYLILQFILLRSVFDRFFGKKDGYNVIGGVEPKGEVRQNIILCGHHDSTWICNFLEKNPQYYAFIMIVPVVLYAVELLLCIIIMTAPADGHVNSIMFQIYRIFSFSGLVFVFPLFFYHNRKGTPGAGDNLVSSIMCIRTPDTYKRIYGDLKHTRLTVLSTDGEECGQKGARDYVLRHLEELRKMKTIVFNVDSIYSVKDLAFLLNETNGTIKLNPALADEISKMAEKEGFRIRVKKIPPGGGGTDAGQFAREKIDIISCIGISTDLVREMINYHTSRDTVENLDPEALEAVMRIMLLFIKKKDSEAE